jgi:suppressor of G2 allele of SKP1
MNGFQCISVPFHPKFNQIPPAMMTSKIRHEYFQTDAVVTLDIFIKNLRKEQVSVEFQPDSVSVSVESDGNRSTVLDFQLFHDIDPSGSKFEILSTKLEIVMAKKQQGLKWQSLEGDGRSVAPAMMNSEEKAPAYPTSSKKVAI